MKVISFLPYFVFRCKYEGYRDGSMLAAIPVEIDWYEWLFHDKYVDCGFIWGRMTSQLEVGVSGIYSSYNSSWSAWRTTHCTWPALHLAWAFRHPALSGKLFDDRRISKEPGQDGGAIGLWRLRLIVLRAVLVKDEVDHFASDGMNNKLEEYQRVRQ